MKRLFNTAISVMLTLILIPSTVFAQKTEDSTTQAPPKYESSQGIDTSFLQSDAKIPYIHSKSAILMDAKTGEILFQKNSKAKCHPASTTKCMTSLLACENGNMGSVLTLTDTAVFSIELGSSHVGLDVGEKLTLEQILYGVMLESGNEASNAVAEHISGSISAFTDLMNQRAKELGCVNTHFANANGLYKKDHYSCPYDMALIVRQALKNDNWRKFSSTVSYTCPPTNKQKESRHWFNHHKMVSNQPGYNYNGIEGGKTGYTVDSKYSLVSYAKRGDLELICVCMKCETSPDIYKDTKNLFNFGFDNFSIMKPHANFTSENNDLDPLQKNYKSIFPNSLITFTTDEAENPSQLVVSNTADISKIESKFKTDFDYEKKKLGVFEFMSDNKVVAKSTIYFSTSGLEEKYTGDPEIIHTQKIRKLIFFAVICFLALLLILIIFHKISGKKKLSFSPSKKRNHAKKASYKNDDIPISEKTTSTLLSHEDIMKMQAQNNEKFERKMKNKHPRTASSSNSSKPLPENMFEINLPDNTSPVIQEITTKDLKKKPSAQQKKEDKIRKATENEKARITAEIEKAKKAEENEHSKKLAQERKNKRKKELERKKQNENLSKEKDTLNISNTQKQDDKISSATSKEETLKKTKTADSVNTKTSTTDFSQIPHIKNTDNIKEREEIINEIRNEEKEKSSLNTDTHKLENDTKETSKKSSNKKKKEKVKKSNSNKKSNAKDLEADVNNNTEKDAKEVSTKQETKQQDNRNSINDSAMQIAKDISNLTKPIPKKELDRNEILRTAKKEVIANKSSKVKKATIKTNLDDILNSTSPILETISDTAKEVKERSLKTQQEKERLQKERTAKKANSSSNNESQIKKINTTSLSDEKSDMQDSISIAKEIESKATKAALSERKVFKPEVNVNEYLQPKASDKKANSVFSVFGKSSKKKDNK